MTAGFFFASFSVRAHCPAHRKPAAIPAQLSTYGQIAWLWSGGRPALPRFGGSLNWRLHKPGHAMPVNLKATATAILFACLSLSVSAQTEDGETGQQEEKDYQSPHQVGDSRHTNHPALQAHQSASAAAQTRAEQDAKDRETEEGDDNSEVCGAILCMSGPGSAAPHECKPYVEAYFKIRVYKHGTFRTKFDPIRTAKKRYEKVLAACPDARQSDRDRIHGLFGHLQYSPFLFN
jgi:hypothetical protein